MSSEQWARAVREQLRLGRVLPLGVTAAPVWITEQAAVFVLRDAARGVAGARVGMMRMAPAGAAALPAGAPPGAVPRGPLRLDAGFEAAQGAPIPDTAERLRTALWEAARRRVGLDLAAVDLTVTGLLDGVSAGPPEETGVAPGDDAGGMPGGDVGSPPYGGPDAASGARDGGEAEDEASALVRALPGVAGLSARLGGFAAGVQVRRDGVQAQIAVAAGHRPVDVALRVRDSLLTAVGADQVTVVVSEVG